MFPIVTVNSSKAEAIEPLGTKRKFWYTDRGRRLLFKAEERGTGEDWAEKIACELAGLLKLPHVHYELAMIDGITPGVICENCAPAPSSLVLGNLIRYDISSCRNIRVQRIGHFGLWLHGTNSGTMNEFFSGTLPDMQEVDSSSLLSPTINPFQ